MVRLNILKPLPDGAGYYYGYYKTRSVNVRQDKDSGRWLAWVDGERIPNERISFGSKADAEDAAQMWIDDPHGGAR